MNDLPKNIGGSRKRAVNLSLNAELVQAARALDINVSEACERGLTAEVQKAREDRWLSENRDVLIAWNDWVQENGMPYDEYRSA